MAQLVTKITRGAVFTFEYRVDLSLEEKNILKRLDAFEHRLGCAGEYVTVRDLTTGQRTEFLTISAVLDHERHVKAAAIALREMIESLRALGAERSVLL